MPQVLRQNDSVDRPSPPRVTGFGLNLATNLHSQMQNPKPPLVRLPKGACVVGQGTVGRVVAAPALLPRTGPLIQKLTSEPQEGFVFKELRGPGFDCPWHAHPEYELILVLRADGYRIVGDSLESLTEGDMVLLGAGLPHIWHHERSRTSRGVHALLIQFEREPWGDRLLMLPAFKPIRKLLERAARGLHVTGQTRDVVAGLMVQMATVGEYDRALHFLQILGLLAASGECLPIASESFGAECDQWELKRMNQVFQYLNGHLDCPMCMADAAQANGMSEGVFSRFLRRHTGKTFPEFVNELRVGRACRLLLEDDRNITQICYECGFSNVSNFNRQFLRLKGASPRAFRERMHRGVLGLARAAPTQVVNG